MHHGLDSSDAVLWDIICTSTLVTDFGFALSEYVYPPMLIIPFLIAIAVACTAIGLLVLSSPAGVREDIIGYVRQYQTHLQ